MTVVIVIHGCRLFARNGAIVHPRELTPSIRSSLFVLTWLPLRLKIVRSLIGSISSAECNAAVMFFGFFVYLGFFCLISPHFALS